VSNGPIEPAADLRQLANMLRQTYLALVQEGFTEREALAIIGQIIVANAKGEAS
jgi:hypothetical protein